MNNKDNLKLTDSLEAGCKKPFIFTELLSYSIEIHSVTHLLFPCLQLFSKRSSALASWWLTTCQKLLQASTSWGRTEDMPIKNKYNNSKGCKDECNPSALRIFILLLEHLKFTHFVKKMSKAVENGLPNDKCWWHFKFCDDKCLSNFIL